MYDAGPSGDQGAAIFTDDVSLQVFMEHLKRLVSPIFHPLIFWTWIFICDDNCAGCGGFSYLDTVVFLTVFQSVKCVPQFV